MNIYKTQLFQYCNKIEMGLLDIKYNSSNLHGFVINIAPYTSLNELLDNQFVDEFLNVVRECLLPA